MPIDVEGSCEECVELYLKESDLAVIEISEVLKEVSENTGLSQLEYLAGVGMWVRQVAG